MSGQLQIGVNAVKRRKKIYMLPRFLQSTPRRRLSKFIFLWAILTFACKPEPDTMASSSPPPPVYFSKNWKAEIDFPAGAELNNRCGIVPGDNGDLITFLSTNNGFLQSVSHDKGITWSPLKSKFAFDRIAVPIFFKERFCGAITWEKIANGGQFYFHARKEEGWTEPSPIRDTNWGDFSLSTIAADSPGNFYCAWGDWRQGNSDIYFSSSFDGGKTWNANVRLDDDQTGQEQTDCRLIATSEGTLYAFWADNCDPETLFDIYCSSSSDGGKNWNPGTKVNDDTTHTFQTSPFAVVDAHGALYAVWSDYRDKGASGDILPSIYFARSANGGKSWKPNIRISTVSYEHNLTPVLALAENGQLHCMWMSTEDYIRSDIFHSYSRDGGNLWSEPVPVNDNIAFKEPIPEERWYLGMARAETPLLSAFRQSQILFGVVLAFGLALAIAGTFYIARKITTPISRLALAAQKFVRGHLESDIAITSRDEIGELANDFNQMAADLKRLISERRANETLLAIGKFSAALAHDLRNPVEGLKLLSRELGKRINPKQPEREIADTISEAVDRLSSLVNQSLDFARLHQPVFVPANLAALADEVLRDFRFDEIELKKDFAPELPLVNVDVAQIRRVLANLIRNALEACRSRRAAAPCRLSLALRVVAGKILFEVADTGLGIPEEIREKIFEPFFSTKPAGHGLGLALARQIISNHGGTITFSGEMGRGTRFVIELPMANKL